MSGCGARGLVLICLLVGCSSTKRSEPRQDASGETRVDALSASPSDSATAPSPDTSNPGATNPDTAGSVVPNVDGPTGTLSEANPPQADVGGRPPSTDAAGSDGSLPMDVNVPDSPSLQARDTLPADQWRQEVRPDGTRGDVSYTDACQAVAGGTFVSQALKSGCAGRPASGGGPTGCYRFVTFGNGGNFTADSGDIVVSGTYTCQGWKLNMTGNAIPGSYDPTMDTVTWEGSLYLRMQASSERSPLCPC